MSPVPTPPAGRAGAWFPFVELRVAGRFAPPDGRYLLRDGPGGDGVTHVVVLDVVTGEARSGDDPAPLLAGGRARVIDARVPLPDARAAQAWLAGAAADDPARLDDALAALRRLLHAHRLAAADAAAAPLSRARLVSAGLGVADGQTLAAGRGEATRELRTGEDERALRNGVRRGLRGMVGGGRARRRGTPAEAALAALLSGRRAPLVCEELVLRARLDLEEDRPREAALQLLVALDAALAELPGDAGDPGAQALGDRLAELRGRRTEVAAAAQAALAGPPSPQAQATVAEVVGRIEAALRARTAYAPD